MVNDIVATTPPVDLSGRIIEIQGLGRIEWCVGFRDGRYRAMRGYADIARDYKGMRSPPFSMEGYATREEALRALGEFLADFPDVSTRDPYLRSYMQNTLGIDTNPKPAGGSMKTRNPVRFKAGKRLTNEERNQVLRSMGDSYRDLNAPKEVKYIDEWTGEEVTGYAHSPDHMYVSDITGKKIRRYITLPDGRIAHPTELFPNIKKSDITRHLNEARERARQLEALVQNRRKHYRNAHTIAEAESIWRRLNAEIIEKFPWHLTGDPRTYLRGPEGDVVATTIDDHAQVLQSKGYVVINTKTNPKPAGGSMKSRNPKANANPATRKIRRDKLRRDIEAGKIEARLQYHYDGRVVKKGKEWHDAVVIPYGDRSRIDAYAQHLVCFDPHDFKYKTGAAYMHDDGIIQLSLPGGESWYLRYKETANKGNPMLHHGVRTRFRRGTPEYVVYYGERSTPYTKSKAFTSLEEAMRFKESRPNPTEWDPEKWETLRKQIRAGNLSPSGRCVMCGKKLTKKQQESDRFLCPDCGNVALRTGFLPFLKSYPKVASEHADVIRGATTPNPKTGVHAQKQPWEVTREDLNYNRNREVAQSNSFFVNGMFAGHGPKVGDTFTWLVNGRKATIKKVKSFKNSVNPYADRTDVFLVEVAASSYQLPGTSGGTKEKHEMSLADMARQGYDLSRLAPQRANPKTNVHPLALEARNRYHEDKKAGHDSAAEYWRGQAGAFFTQNPVRQRNPYGLRGMSYGNYSSLSKELYRAMAEASRVIYRPVYLWYDQFRRTHVCSPDYPYLPNQPFMVFNSKGEWYDVDPTGRVVRVSDDKDLAERFSLNKRTPREVFQNPATSNPVSRIPIVGDTVRSLNQRQFGNVIDVSRDGKKIRVDMYGRKKPVWVNANKYYLVSRPSEHQNPILGTIGTSLLSGVGLGVGFKVVDEGYKRVKGSFKGGKSSG